MLVGALQFKPVFGNHKETVCEIEKFKEEFKNLDLLVLPELCNSGYNFKNEKEAQSLAETLDDSAFIKFIEFICCEYDMYVVTGFNEKEGHKIYNSSLLYGPKGFIGKYRKLHLFNREKDFFTPGEQGVQVYEAGEMRIGMQVCFDWSFPETWRILGLKGADIVCHPSNLVLQGHSQTATPAHGLINHYYVITANRTGTEDDLEFTGNSIISSPDGKILAEADKDSTVLIKAEIDLEKSRNKYKTPENHIFMDRRKDIYGDLDF